MPLSGRLDWAMASRAKNHSDWMSMPKSDPPRAGICHASARKAIPNWRGTGTRMTCVSPATMATMRRMAAMHTA